jgi:hypothetical protein
VCKAVHPRRTVLGEGEQEIVNLLRLPHSGGVARMSVIRTLPVARVLFSCARPMRISFALRNASSRCTVDLAGVTARLPGAICPSYERGVPQAASHESFVNLSVSSSQNLEAVCHTARLS